MKVKSLEDLRKIKENAKDLTSARSGGETRVIEIGRASCRERV